MKLTIRQVDATRSGCLVFFESLVGSAWAIWKGAQPSVGQTYHAELSVPACPIAVEARSLMDNRLCGREDGVVQLSGRIVDAWDESEGRGVTVDVSGERVLVELAPDQLAKCSIGNSVMLTLARIELEPFDL